MRIMKLRKNLTLDAKAVARGERAAAQRKLSLSALIEKQLLSLPAEADEDEYWPGPAGAMLERPGDPRTAYLKAKYR
jgi:hypothetical protein